MASPESEIKKAGSAFSAPDSSGAQVPFMITRKMEEQLRAQGLDQKRIDGMKPAEARALLKKKEEKGAPVEAIPAAKQEWIDFNKQLDSLGLKVRYAAEIRRFVYRCGLDRIDVAERLRAAGKSGDELNEAYLVEAGKIKEEAWGRIHGLVEKYSPRKDLQPNDLQVIFDRLSHDATQEEIDNDWLTNIPYTEPAKDMPISVVKSIPDVPAAPLSPTPIEIPPVIGNNGKTTTMPIEGVSQPGGAEPEKTREEKELAEFAAAGSALKLSSEKISAIKDMIDEAKAQRGSLVIGYGETPDALSGPALRDFVEAMERGQRRVLEVIRKGHPDNLKLKMGDVPKEWMQRLTEYTLPQGPLKPVGWPNDEPAPPVPPKPKNGAPTPPYVNPFSEMTMSPVQQYDLPGFDAEPAKKPRAPRKKKSALGEVLDAAKSDLGDKADTKGGKGREASKKDKAPEAPARRTQGSEVVGEEEEVSDTLKAARQWRAEQEAVAKTESVAGPLTVEDAQKSSDFERYMLAYFPDGNADGGEVSPEKLAIYVEAFNKYRETVGQMADVFVEMLGKGGVVKIAESTRAEIMSDIDVFLLKNVKGQPGFLDQIRIDILNFKEAPARIAEKEAILASIGPRDVLVAGRDALIKGKAEKAKLESDYGKGPADSFFKGFLKGFNKTIRERSEIDFVLGSESMRVRPGLKKIEEKGTFMERLTRGWKGGMEAKTKSDEAEKEMGSARFKEIVNALEMGTLKNLEDKIRTLNDADREKNNATIALDKGRKLIFEGIGQLSGVRKRIEEMAQNQVRTMLRGEGDLEAKQGDYERMLKASVRLGEGEAGYLGADRVNSALVDMETLVQHEFRNRIKEAIDQNLPDVLGKYARMEKLGSKHAGEVKAKFKEIVDVLMKDSKVTSAQRLRMSILMGSFNAEQTPAAATENTSEAPRRESAPTGAPEESEEAEELKAPKVGDRISFNVMVDGKSVSHNDFVIEKFNFKQGEPVKPSDEMTVSGIDPTRKGGKKVTLKVPYWQYMQQKSKPEAHA